MVSLMAIKPDDEDWDAASRGSITNDESDDSFYSVKQAPVDDDNSKAATDSSGFPIDTENVNGENAAFDASRTVNPRAYQLEMLDESLKGNLIVAVSSPCTNFEPQAT